MEENKERVDHPSYYNEGAPIIYKEFMIHNSDIEDAVGEIFLVKKKIELECIDVIRDMPTWKGNAIKYLWRAGMKKEIGMSDMKKEIEDLEKALWYIQDRIAQVKRKDIEEMA